MPERLAGFLFVFATLGFTVAGQLLLKWRALAASEATVEGDRLSYLIRMFSDLFVWGGLGMAVFASVCWMLAVQNLPVSLAYPFMALSFVFVPVLAFFVFGDGLGWWQGLGMVLIVVGVGLTSMAR